MRVFSICRYVVERPTYPQFRFILGFRPLLRKNHASFKKMPNIGADYPPALSIAGGVPRILRGAALQEKSSALASGQKPEAVDCTAGHEMHW